MRSQERQSNKKARQMSARIIPRLDIKGPNLVKGIHLEGLRVLGKPEVFAKYYYDSGADELIYMDVVASLYGRNNILDIVRRTAQEIFIPLTVGGGLRTLNDISAVLGAGADKVSINTAAVSDPEFIKKASRRFGSSTIVISIEAIKQPDGIYLAYTDNGRQETGKEVREWALRAQEMGAGEILLTSIDKEGTGEGYDVELTRMVSEAVDIPVIALGGAGSADDVLEVIAKGKADAASMASILHYYFLEHYDMLKHEYTCEGNIEFLKSGRAFSKIKITQLRDIKNIFIEKNIDCRP